VSSGSQQAPLVGRRIRRDRLSRGQQESFEYGFLIDQNLTVDLVQALSDEGYAATHTSRVGLDTATDQEVFRFACQHGLVIITHDHDFVSNRTQFGPPHPGIVLIELPQRWSIEDLVRRIVMALRGLRGQSIEDRLVIIEPSQVTVRAQ
jgi:predicted nuclease of predicted toxin-antitoxin system